MTDQVIQFQMHGCREILGSSGKAEFLRQQVYTLERAVDENPSLAFDLAKSIIETTCKTILIDRGVVIPDDWTKNIEKLFKNTVANMEFVPSNHPDKTKTLLGMENVLSGLSTAVLGLAQIRNNEGTASHGKDAYRPTLSSFQALMAARAADTIVHYLFLAHKTYPSSSVVRRVNYGDESGFDQYINENNNPITIFSYTYDASEVLFYVDENAYRDELDQFRAQAKASAPSGSAESTEA